jgi:hypothetical protein
MMTMDSQGLPPTPQLSSSINPVFDDSVNFSDLGSLSDLFHDEQDFDDDGDFLTSSFHSNLSFGKDEFSSGFSPNLITSLDGSHSEQVGDNQMMMSSYTVSTVPVQQPNENDVLLGRGGRNNQWSGNEQLREMAREMCDAYSAAPKRNKPAIAMLLVLKVRALTPMGRYVR